MNPTPSIVFFDDLSPEQAEALRRLLESDPKAARLFEQWRTLRGMLRHVLRTRVADRELFALFVLSEAGRGDLLSREERADVEKAAPELREALRRHAGFAAVAKDIRSDAVQFDETWEEWFGRESDGPDRAVQRPATRRRSPRSRWVVRAGIGTAVLAFAVLLLVVGRRDFASVTITTEADEVRLVELGDGSEVRLLGASRLTYVPTGSPIDRRVEFEGRAYFEVVASDRGFVVLTPHAQAVVLGTSFGVRAGEEETEIVLAEGRLSLAPRQAPEQAVVLQPGQMSRVEAGQRPTAPRDIRIHDRLAWTGLFVFRAETLEVILAELGRHYGVDLTADEALSTEQVTGRFERDQELRTILDVLATAVGARVERTDGGGYRLTH